jgi:hypothetical protein
LQVQGRYWGDGVRVPLIKASVKRLERIWFMTLKAVPFSMLENVCSFGQASLIWKEFGYGSHGVVFNY